MKVLVTLGTTRFESLVRFFDKHIEGVDITFQFIGEDEPPKYWPNLGFVQDFNSLLEKQDLVITHCGAGNVYSLLEKNIQFCAVPNLDRKDRHQLELANFLQLHKLAYVFNLVESNFISPKKVIEAASGFKRNRYVNQHPFNIDLLVNEIFTV